MNIFRMCFSERSLLLPRMKIKQNRVAIKEQIFLEKYQSTFKNNKQSDMCNKIIFRRKESD